jgi:alanine racemase
MSNSAIEINLSIFKNNLKSIRSHINTINKPPMFCLPVKADAYGHGIEQIAQAAENYVDYYGVACLDEGVILRKSGILKPILVFGALNDDDIESLVKNNLEITISSKYKAIQVAKFCKQYNVIGKIHIKIDTGMGRVGVRPSSAKDLIEFIKNDESLEIIGIYSHLACSDEPDKSFTNQQITEFKQIVESIKKTNPNILCHIANSAAVCNYPESYFDMVRPGILSYGYYPNEPITLGGLAQIKPFYTLKSKVVFFKTMDAGKSISYNQTYVTKSFTRVITIPIGYGDGYRRILSNKGLILLNGKKYTISGTICMDMLMVDIGIDGTANIGDEIVLIGTQMGQIIPIEDLAMKCQTNVYEILCSFTSRVNRVYLS